MSEISKNSILLPSFFFFFNGITLSYNLALPERAKELASTSQHFLIYLLRLQLIWIYSVLECPKWGTFLQASLEIRALIKVFPFGHLRIEAHKDHPFINLGN